MEKNLRTPTPGNPMKNILVIKRRYGLYAKCDFVSSLTLKVIKTLFLPEFIVEAIKKDSFEVIDIEEELAEMARNN